MSHVLNAAIDHPDWCEWVGLIEGIVMPLTGEVKFRCPGCWGIPEPAPRELAYGQA